ncbi:hypothetical protein RclHR1_05910013 [Rhizophagus clarus]|uniref:Protein kinase domain-containing protein n=1 Tax=Rhizophagus clarus TaxID=94130 RepID=A0A2Z6S6P4_9GLOM|nr:hypothetical protein RclHR1_05910013 [Rhizophagus clarus]
MVVMDYANKGNLRTKSYSLYFHDGNILNHEDEEDEDDKNKVFISDLGLCKAANFLKEYDIYGVIPFMAPEVLRGKPYTPASDIYSFSMIMWEFTSGVPPFNDRAHDFQLSISICKGERPEIIKSTPQCYVNLMKKCWSEDPLKRPSAKEVSSIIENWIFYHETNDDKTNDDKTSDDKTSDDKTNDDETSDDETSDDETSDDETCDDETCDGEINEFNYGKISKELKNNIMEFINAPIGNNNLITESHPQAYYTSRLLDFTSIKVNEILESKCLD